MEQKATKTGYREGSFKGELKEFDEQSRKTSGFFASFDTLDSDEDVILEGAFAKSIKERGVNSNSNRKIAYLHQHNVKEPIGRLDVLEEQKKGLYYEGEVEKTPLGDIVVERFKMGIYREHSIGFQYVEKKCDWGKFGNKEAFLCSELNLFEGSVVTFGANKNTPFTGFKSEDPEAILKELEQQEAFLVKNAQDYLQEITFKQIFSREKALVRQLAEVKSTSKEESRQQFQEEQKAKSQAEKINFYKTLIS